jgi:hypothetical protein
VFKSVILATALLSAGSTFAATNLISNGDFSQNSVPVGDYGYANGFHAPVSAVSWDFVGVTGIENQSSAWSPFAAAQTAAFIQYYGGFQDNSSSISQTFASTSSAFNVSFDLAGRPGYGTESINVFINGVAVGSNVSTSTTDAYTHFSFNVTGMTGNTHTLSFQGGNASAYDSAVFLDNVAVTAVPEPETYALLLAGMGLIGGVLKRRKAVKA